jgi:SAM-dependent methyltransferase
MGKGEVGGDNQSRSLRLILRGVGAACLGLFLAFWCWHSPGRRKLTQPEIDGAFDAIVCMDAMCHLPDRGRLLGEWRRVLRPGGRLLYTDPVVVTGLVSNEELATRSSTGYFEFCPPGVNERWIGQAGFELVRAEDVTENEVEVSRRWHAARQQRAAELTRLEGDETFAGLQRFLATVHRLTSERRLSRFAYLGRKPGG